MTLIKSLVVSFVAISILNVIINKDSKYLKRNIGVIHYILGYFFIVYLNYTLKITLRFNHPVFDPDINLIPFKYGFGIENMLNMVLFMPLGFLLPALWEKYRNFWSILCYGMFFSLFIEIGQLFMHRATDINDLIMNTIGAVAGWVIFNVIRKGSCKFSAKTAIDICSSDTLAIKLESCVYVLVAVMCLF